MQALLDGISGLTVKWTLVPLGQGRSLASHATYQALLKATTKDKDSNPNLMVRVDVKAPISFCLESWNTCFAHLLFDLLTFVRPFLCYLHRLVNDHLTAFCYSFSNFVVCIIGRSLIDQLHFVRLF
jgi:hypothetical protein